MDTSSRCKAESVALWAEKINRKGTCRLGEGSQEGRQCWEMLAPAGRGVKRKGALSDLESACS